MITIASAPCRISLFGGGTDVEPFVSKYGGSVISVAINLRQHLTVYTGHDLWGRGKDEFPDKGTPQFLYDIFHKFRYGGGHTIKLKSQSDAFLSAGLGSSAAAAVATVAAISKIKGLPMTRDQIATEAWLAEQHMGWYGGKQDQWAATYGGLNVMDFTATSVQCFTFNRALVESLQKALVLVYLGDRVFKKPQEQLRELSSEQMKALVELREMARGSIPFFFSADYYKIGKLMDLAWKMKKRSNPVVSNASIDAVYEKALKFGALGGKVCGAGSGGYMLFIVEPELRRRFIEQMKEEHIEDVDFQFDWQGVEARIV